MWTLTNSWKLIDKMNSKANDVDVVKLTGNQQINWAKTFLAEPFMPSKTRAPVYNWQRFASEAQVYNKQDKLTFTNWIVNRDNTVSLVKQPIEYSAWAWISLDWEWDYTAMQWPAPSWFHIPTKEDWEWVIEIMSWLTFEYSWWLAYLYALKLPPAGMRNYDDADVMYQWWLWKYWTSTPYIGEYSAYSFNVDMAEVSVAKNMRWYWYSLRCFKDSFEEPDSSWTVLNWTLWSAWVFWDETNWLISVTSDWTTWYTLMDKNMWATAVYWYLTRVEAATCWLYYQWWNNMWKAWSWIITTTSTQVDTTWYWPGNYYSGNAFIQEYDWSLEPNDNLWWWVDWKKPTITNIWVTSVNWQTWDVSITLWEDTVYCTQAEYDSLPSSKYSDNISYVIYE